MPIGERTRVEVIIQIPSNTPNGNYYGEISVDAHDEGAYINKELGGIAHLYNAKEYCVEIDDTTTTITSTTTSNPERPQPPPSSEHGTLHIKAYPSGYHWPDDIPESDLSASVEAHYRFDGSWETKVFSTPFSITCDHDSTVTLQVIEPYPQGYTADSNLAWDVYGSGFIQGETIEVTIFSDRTVIAYLSEKLISTQTTEIQTSSIPPIQAIPGFSVESILIGLGIGMLVIQIFKRWRARR